jgi:predicted  nucleic acid-binding Zn-ribbon protein
MHQSDLVVKDEDARRLRVRIAMLKDDAATLREQLAQKDESINKLSESFDDIRSQLDAMTQKCQEQDKQLRSQMREQSNLRVSPATVYATAS